MLQSPTHSLSTLELTHVYYDPNDPLSHLLAILTLSPMLVIPAYLAVFVFEREATVLNMLAGQLVNEAWSWVLKRYIKSERPFAALGSGYASPSSHSQFFGFLFTFILLHLTFVQRPSHTSRWSPTQRTLWLRKRLFVIFGVGVWSFAVCFSRWYLSYHTPRQIALGFWLGSLFAVVHCTLTEIIPRNLPSSYLGQARRWVVQSLLGAPILNLLEVEDRWSREGWEGKRGWSETVGGPGVARVGNRKMD